MLTDVDLDVERTGGYPYDGQSETLPPHLPVDSTLRVLFLDFDGVLNGPMQGGETFKILPEPWAVLDRACIRRVNRITDATGAQIVVSSSWRYAIRQSMPRLLCEAGLTAPFLSMTPLCGWAQKMYGPPYRGREIACWLKLFERVHGFLPRGMVILDDNTYMEPVNSYAVFTDGDRGLQEHHVPKAIRRLARPVRMRLSKT